MQTNILDLQIKLTNVADLEEFANDIKEVVIKRIALLEHFSGVRLTNTSVRYNDWLHKVRGRTFDNGTLEVRQTESTLQLAGTVVHELGHALVGVNAQHDSNWHDACKASGLIFVEEKGQQYKPEHFTQDILDAISQAIDRFAKRHPKLVYDPNIEIPWPDRIGTYECVLRSTHDNGCAKHTDHVMKFQIDGIREMLSRDGNILLADEMGLGKTVEAMGYINATHPLRILVGCPNNAKLVWKRHFEKWCVHPYDVEVAYTALYTFGDVVIMNYEAVVKWSDALRKQEWDLVIYDEGHYLKTPSAKRSQACYKIHGKKAIIISGTPIVNYPYELFPLIHYLDQQRWPEYGRFEASYGSRSSERLGRNLNRLNAELRLSIMTRRLKKDVLTELPRKRRQIIEFEVSDDVRKLIEEEKRLFQASQGNNTEMVKFLNAMKNDSDVANDDIDWAAIVESMKYTRRYAFEEMAKIAHKIGLAKLPLAIEHIENALEAKEKVIVFGHHRDVLQTIADKFKGALHLGGMQDQASEIAERFNNSDEIRVFVGQVTIAQAYSLKGSSTVIFVEEDWVPGVMTQAEDRAHGIGRGDDEAKSMLIQHLVFEDSLDTYKAKLTIRKQKSIDRAMNKQ